MAFKNWVKGGFITQETIQIHKLHEKCAKKNIKKKNTMNYLKKNPDLFTCDTYSICNIIRCNSGTDPALHNASVKAGNGEPRPQTGYRTLVVRGQECVF